MNQTSKLTLLALSLSLLIIFQSIGIINKVNFFKNNSPQAGEIFLGDITIDETKENIDQPVNIWLEGKSNNQVNIWLESPIPVYLYDFKINFNPQELEIVDSLNNVEGIQIDRGDLNSYLKNLVNINSGEIRLSGFIPQDNHSKILLGIINYNKLTSGQTIISWEFEENSKDGSFVINNENGQNILNKPMGIEL